MFTVQQIEQAHSHVQSGADFPEYTRQIKAMGVIAFETWVKDSHTDYLGVEAYTTSSDAMYEDLTIASICDKATFEQQLKAHQQGDTDYETFCKHCAQSGIEKWIVNLDQMTCTYYDTKGSLILEEQIPQ